MQDNKENMTRRKGVSSIVEVIGVVLVGLGTLAGFLGIWHNRQNRPSPAPISIMKLPSGQIVPLGGEDTAGRSVGAETLVIILKQPEPGEGLASKAISQQGHVETVYVQPSAAVRVPQEVSSPQPEHTGRRKASPKTLEKLFVNPKDGFRMVLVSGGSFLMGSPVGQGGEDEHPQHKVNVGPFYISEHEVTNKQYKKFCDATGRKYPPDPRFTGMSDYFLKYPDYPVVDVGWVDAKEYASWAGGRLPTEVEWELAAGGANGHLYPWGDESPGGGTYRCNYRPDKEESSWSLDGFKYTSAVASYSNSRSACGAHDMAGNVWEWCADWYNSQYYSVGHNDNPKGPEVGSKKVIRGGSWYRSAGSCRSANRNSLDPARKYNDVGFRYVKDMK